jgi:hypothetical protein
MNKEELIKKVKSALTENPDKVITPSELEDALIDIVNSIGESSAGQEPVVKFPSASVENRIAATLCNAITHEGYGECYAVSMLLDVSPDDDGTCTLSTYYAAVPEGMLRILNDPNYTISMFHTDSMMYEDEYMSLEYVHFMPDFDAQNLSVEFTVRGVGGGETRKHVFFILSPLS